MSRDTIDALCHHAATVQAHQVDDPARTAAGVFILDSLGVGMAGSRGPLCAALMQSNGTPGPARVLGTGQRRSPSEAALLNAYQVHNSEFDCIHDAAVVHPMAVLLGAALATVDTSPVPITGDEFLAAVVAGVDVGCRIGAASRAPMRFFRPATAGAFAATAAAGRLRGFDEKRLLAAMGVTLAQLCGTMQVHLEGSALLPVQAGFNARNAVASCDMAALGVSGARQVLDGPFGYFALFEGEHDPTAVTAGLGEKWSISEVAHKPFPSGRATHGVVEACLQLRRSHGLESGRIAAVEAQVPPLTQRLVGRAPEDGMQPNYARLCGAYVAARALLTGHVKLDDFAPGALSDPDTLRLAKRIRFVVDDNTDPNALAPVTVRLRLDDGRNHEHRVDTVYGSPEKPMTRDAHLAKFRSNCRAALVPPPEAGVAAAIDSVDDLARCPDVRTLFERLEPVA